MFDDHYLSGTAQPCGMTAGKYVELPDTISGFKGILDGKYDDLPEMAFYMVGDIKEVQEKADKMAKEMGEGK